MTQEAEQLNISQEVVASRFQAIFQTDRARNILDPEAFDFEQGRLKVDVFDPQFSSEQVLGWMRQLMMVLDPHLRESLDAGFKYGFNLHGLAHSEDVGGDTPRIYQLIIDDKDFDQMEEKKAIVAGYDHDMPNLFGREGHDGNARMVFEHLFGVSKEANGHSADALDDVIFAVEHHRGEEIEEIADYLVWHDEHPLTLALIIADKVHMAKYHRVNPAANVKNGRERSALEADPHFVVNLFTSRSFLSVAHTQALVVFNFSPDVPGDLSALVKIRDNGFRGWAPDEWQQRYRASGGKIQYFDSYVPEFVRIYMGKLMVLQAALLAAFPDLSGIHTEIVDWEDTVLRNEQDFLVQRVSWGGDTNYNWPQALATQFGWLMEMDGFLSDEYREKFVAKAGELGERGLVAWEEAQRRNQEEGED